MNRVAGALRKSCCLALLALSAGGAHAAEQAAASSGAESAVAAWQVLVMLAYLAVLGGGALLLVRWRRMRGGPVSGAGRQIEVVEARRVTPSATVLLIKVRGKPFVAMSSGAGVALQALPEDVP